jgi:prepilin peptidase CpaA
MNVQISIYIFLFCQIVLVAINDIKYRKISNQWFFLNVSLFIFGVVCLPGLYQFNSQTFLYSLVFLGVGLLGFALKIMGAGDSKYLFSLFLLTPQVWHDKSFNLLLISTMIIGGFSFITQFTQNYEKIISFSKSGYFLGVKECLGNKFPYAPVILMSWIWLGFYVI